MSGKEEFISKVKELIENESLILTEEGIEYFESLSKSRAKKWTANGIKIINTMQNYITAYDNKFKAQQIGEILSISGRSVSGSIRKLIADGYVTKSKTTPIVYSLTDAGKEVTDFE